MILLCLILLPLATADIGFGEQDYGVHFLTPSTSGNSTTNYYNNTYYTTNVTGITNISQANDTDISSPANGEVLVWSTAVMQWVNSPPVSGWTSTALSDLDMDNYRLTNVGSIIMNGAIYGEDILPSQNMTYSIGNSTDWYLKIYVGNIYSENITSYLLNSTNIDSILLNSENITSDNLDSSNILSDDVNISNNLTIGGTKISTVGNVTFYKSVN